MTQLKDVIHFYLGQDLRIYDKATEKWSGWKKLTPKVLDYVLQSEISGYLVNFEMQLSLRRLDSMTEEEAIEVTKPVVVYGDLPNVRKYETWKNPFGKIVVSWGNGLREKYVPQDETSFTVGQFTYLLSRGFWLFGDEAFEQGLIIDKNKITTP